MNKTIIILIVCLLPVFFLGCGGEESSEQRFSFENKDQFVPQFNADSAYHFIEEQVALGPRNPGSEGHRKTKAFLLNTLRDFSSERTVFPQNFTAKGYQGEELKLTNIIAAFNTQSSDRIMLCAHWDTRPRADKADKNKQEPILGADDGGSGVGVLLELARLFKENPPPIGVDIVLFDGEDYGKEGDLDNYFLGSRYWAQNPPVKGYSPRFGILLDMVGGKGAQFPKEQYSMHFAPALVNELWSIADQKNHGQLFLDKKGNAISDDHLIINRDLQIPTIDIIRHEVTENGAEFAPYWHTHDDNMDIIDKNTLKAVGEVLTELIYNRI
ncbi:M28 family peptidase [Fodinibius halophilus]|uniref:M28 family peptidase n=1 Tax=Fodinibius halophilus TaxID=1736908 RepID=A0A6M1T7G8_9BACT|nr:M28 family peptidase [Fodinibius halophilus]NGP87931.1 M28 family peptidase [Fodinibius halophilus]